MLAATLQIITPTGDTRALRSRARHIILGSTLSLGIAISLLCVMLHHNPKAESGKHRESWLPILSGSYTPVEQVLVLSSAFSLIFAMVVETLLFTVLRKDLIQVRYWLRWTLNLVLAANVILAFSATLVKSIDGLQRDYCDSSSEIDDTPGTACETRQGNRWLSPLLFLFSVVLYLLTWLDCRDDEENGSEEELSRPDGTMADGSEKEKGSGITV
ncbi:hypothetical protein F4778DRAFT_565382 [Xylariomycetidae sp. FL2044]|nr:hypothetical protein F4778DRAFT_565382 [Xylariomycetidae sp. FL2044]